MSKKLYVYEADKIEYDCDFDTDFYHEDFFPQSECSQEEYDLLIQYGDILEKRQALLKKLYDKRKDCNEW